DEEADGPPAAPLELAGGTNHSGDGLFERRRGRAVLEWQVAGAQEALLARDRAAGWSKGKSRSKVCNQVPARVAGFPSARTTADSRIPERQGGRIGGDAHRRSGCPDQTTTRPQCDSCGWRRSLLYYGED